MKLKKLLLGISGLALASTISLATSAEEYYPIYIQDLYTDSSYTIKIQPTGIQSTIQKQTPVAQETYQVEQQTVNTQPVQYVQSVEPVEVQPQETTVTAIQKAEPVEAPRQESTVKALQTATPTEVQTQTTTSTTAKAEKSGTVITKKAPYYNNWSLAEAQKKVSTLGNKLVKVNGFSDMGIKFYVSDEPTVNAYADGNRNVVIFTGLLELCDSEDELAFIMSHEIAHITSYHIAKGQVANTAAGVGAKVAKSKLGGLRSKVANIAKEYGAEELGINPDLVGASVDTAAVAAVSYYDRRQEVDADTRGMDIMQKAGYNPLAGIAIMYRIGDNYNDIFTDHPSTDKRVVKMYNHASENSPKELKKGYDSVYYNEAISIMKSKN